MKIVPIPIDDFDPSKHVLPVAYRPIKAGTLVTLCAGVDTFTVEPFQPNRFPDGVTAFPMNSAYIDGVSWRDAAEGEGVYVVARHFPLAGGEMQTLIYVVAKGHAE